VERQPNRHLQARRRRIRPAQHPGRRHRRTGQEHPRLRHRPVCRADRARKRHRRDLHVHRRCQHRRKNQRRRLRAYRFRRADHCPELLQRRFQLRRKNQRRRLRDHRFQHLHPGPAVESMSNNTMLRNRARHHRDLHRRDPRLVRVAVETLERRQLLTNSIYAYPGADGHFLYKPLPLGDHIQDYSTVGYRGGTAPIPTVAVPADSRATVAAPSGGDDTAIIQAAIDYVSGLALDANGLRGALLLGPGTYRIDGVLNINASGVVLRGSGVQQTLLYATTNTRIDERTIINVNGSNSQTTSNTQNILDKYVPVGAISFTVANASGFAVGDTVIVHRPSTQQWINDMGMNLLTNPWTPGSKDINMDRTITHI